MWSSPGRPGEPGPVVTAAGDTIPEGPVRKVLPFAGFLVGLIGYLDYLGC